MCARSLFTACAIPSLLTAFGSPYHSRPNGSSCLGSRSVFPHKIHDCINRRKKLLATDHFIRLGVYLLYFAVSQTGEATNQSPKGIAVIVPNFGSFLPERSALHSELICSFVGIVALDFGSPSVHETEEISFASISCIFECILPCSAVTCVGEPVISKPSDNNSEQRKSCTGK